ncbi:MAG: hypothetical protein DMF46_09850 [Verrucomicrobia bacterium]|nr:MAG: hypothetical protein DMF46_09850 [Verrucomicrobiota bacterium]
MLDVNSRGFTATFLASPAHVALEGRNPQEKKVAARTFWGSARVSRVGDGVSPPRTSLEPL